MPPSQRKQLPPAPPVLLLAHRLLQLLPNWLPSGRNIPSSYQFVISDSDADSNGIPQILSEEEATPPVSSDHPPTPKVALKRKLKKKAEKEKDEENATVKAPKIKRKKRADVTKSSAKAGKLIVKLPLGQQQLPFSQQLQTLAAKQTK